MADGPSLLLPPKQNMRDWRWGSVIGQRLKLSFESTQIDTRHRVDLHNGLADRFSPRPADKYRQRAADQTAAFFQFTIQALIVKQVAEAQGQGLDPVFGATCLMV